jgi:hypothetical protein
VPTTVVFTGHMIDRPEREKPRFREKDTEAVRAAIDAELERLGAGFGYASAACGSDIIFLEAMLERGGEIHVVLPAPAEAFRAGSVDFAGPEWGKRFDRVLERAASVTLVGGRAPS